MPVVIHPTNPTLFDSSITSDSVPIVESTPSTSSCSTMTPRSNKSNDNFIDKSKKVRQICSYWLSKIRVFLRGRKGGSNDNLDGCELGCTNASGNMFLNVSLSSNFIFQK